MTSPAVMPLVTEHTPPASASGVRPIGVDGISSGQSDFPPAPLTRLRVKGQVYMRDMGDDACGKISDELSIWDGRRWLCMHNKQPRKCTNTDCLHSTTAARRRRSHEGTSQPCVGAPPAKKNKIGTSRGKARKYITFHEHPFSLEDDTDADRCLKDCMESKLKDVFAQLRPDPTKRQYTKKPYGPQHIFYRCGCTGFMHTCPKRVRISRFTDRWVFGQSGDHSHCVSEHKASKVGLKQYPFVCDAVETDLSKFAGHVSISSLTIMLLSDPLVCSC